MNEKRPMVSLRGSAAIEGIAVHCGLLAEDFKKNNEGMTDYDALDAVCEILDLMAVKTREAAIIARCKGITLSEFADTFDPKDDEEEEEGC